MSKERRRWRRIPADLFLELHDVGGKIAKGRAHVKNFSTGGLAAEGHLPLKAGETLFLKVNVPMEFLGKVVYVKNRTGLQFYGIKFLDIGVFDKWRLKRYVTATFKSGRFGH